MEYTITNEPHETLKVSPNNDNDSIMLVQRTRTSSLEEWNSKVTILNRREALLVHKAIEDIILSPRRVYPVMGAQ